MARPLKQGMDYFPHDTDASYDEKIEALEAKHGLIGYAIYFKLLERIYRTPNGELNVSDAETMQILSRKYRIKESHFKEILDTMTRLGLFNREAFTDHSSLTSEAVTRRMVSVLSKRDLMKQRYVESKTGISDAEKGEETQQKPDKVKVKENINNKVNNTLTLFKLPEYIKQEIWDSFLEMRKKQKASPTENAKELLLKELEKLRLAGDDPNEVLNQSIMNNWKGVFALKKHDSNAGHKADNRELPARTEYTEPGEFYKLKGG